MTASSIATVILAAGHGTRMNSALPKVFHEIGGLSMLGHVVRTAQTLSPDRQIVVIGAQAPEVGDAALALSDNIKTAVQNPPRGTGDAVTQALSALDGFNGVVLVLYADTPLVKAETMGALIETVERGGVATAVLGFKPPEPGSYGRLKLNANNGLEAIVEAKDASPDELAISLCNSGVMAVNSDFLRRALPKIEPNNAKNEYYLTDLVAIARREGEECAALTAQTAEVIGVNSKIELSVAEKIFQERRRSEAMASGVTMIDPATVFFSHDTTIEKDVLIEPNVFFGSNVTVKSGARIKAFSHIEGAVIGAAAQAGPFARLRPGAVLETSAKVGNFVEIKKATIGENAKVSHLTYIGDAAVGARANIGAGTITCNYDGFNKHKTIIGADAFIGSNSSLVAPVTIGDGAYVGSGSVITKDVDAGALAVARGRQSIIEGWAARFRKAHVTEEDE